MYADPSASLLHKATHQEGSSLLVNGSFPFPFPIFHFPSSISVLYLSDLSTFRPFDLSTFRPFDLLTFPLLLSFSLCLSSSLYPH